jgi:hypothetical protein
MSNFELGAVAIYIPGSSSLSKFNRSFSVLVSKSGANNAENS